MEYSLTRSKIEDTKQEVAYKRVPWISWDEWNFVRDSLFSSSPDSVGKAVQRIAVWKIRGSLPIVVDATAAIIEIHQIDPKFRKDLKEDDLISERRLASEYCMAILRLVNGVVDQDRNKRGKKDKKELSINEAANEIGLPRMLIDIRHEASHRDIPSLQLLREASVKALDWIKFYYWEPQKNAIPLQRDIIDFVRKKTRFKMHKLAFQLSMKQDAKIGTKRKRNIQSNAGYCNCFPQKVKKLQSLQPRGVKNQITRILQSLFRLYSSHPLEFVAVMLDVLLKALDSSGSNDVKASNDSEPEFLSENSKPQTEVVYLCKYLISKMSRKEPELILIMLRAVLETLKTRETMNAEYGNDSFSFSQSKAEMHQVEQLSSLVLWLIKKYNKLRHPSQKVCGDDIHNSSAKIIAPKVALEELLRKCLLVCFPRNNQLAKSALLLAQLMGNSSLVERLKKLPAVYAANLDNAEESLAQTISEHISGQQEVSITEAEKRLELLKRRQNKDKTASVVADNVDVRMHDGRWTVAKSWNPCPIGMLPGSLGSTGILPILDRGIHVPDDQNASEGKKWELNPCGGSMCDSLDAEALEKIDSMEEGIAVEDDRADDQGLLLDPLKGRLMIGGIYRKVDAEELHAIESAIRILV